METKEELYKGILKYINLDHESLYLESYNINCILDIIENVKMKDIEEIDNKINEILK